MGRHLGHSVTRQFLTKQIKHLKRCPWIIKINSLSRWIITKLSSRPTEISFAPNHPFLLTTLSPTDSGLSFLGIAKRVIWRTAVVKDNHFSKSLFGPANTNWDLSFKYWECHSVARTFTPRENRQTSLISDKTNYIQVRDNGFCLKPPFSIPKCPNWSKSTNFYPLLFLIVKITFTSIAYKRAFRKIPQFEKRSFPYPTPASILSKQQKLDDDASGGCGPDRSNGGACFFASITSPNAIRFLRWTISDGRSFYPWMVVVESRTHIYIPPSTHVFALTSDC